MLREAKLKDVLPKILTVVHIGAGHAPNKLTEIIVSIVFLKNVCMLWKWSIAVNKCLPQDDGQHVPTATVGGGGGRGQ